MTPIIKTELFAVMQASGNYENDDAIICTIQEMRDCVYAGQDPEEVLHEEGFEPDYVFDLLG